MAHQDYVSRPKHKKNNPYKAKQEATAPRISLKIKLIAALTVLAIGCFGYFLWVIKDQQAVELPIEKQTIPANKDKSSDIPKFEGNDYLFQQQLKNKEVKGGEYQVAESAEYGVYCGAFRHYSRAETLKANIAFAGIIAQIKTKTGSKGTWHQVFIGPHPNKRSAEAEKHKLRRNKIDCSIAKWK